MRQQWSNGKNNKRNNENYDRDSLNKILLTKIWDFDNIIKHFVISEVRKYNMFYLFRH